MDVAAVSMIVFMIALPNMIGALRNVPLRYRVAGEMGWAALSISTAGRLKKSYRCGHAWTD